MFVDPLVGPVDREHHRGVRGVKGIEWPGHKGFRVFALLLEQRPALDHRMRDIPRVGLERRQVDSTAFIKEVHRHLQLPGASLRKRRADAARQSIETLAAWMGKSS